MKLKENCNINKSNGFTLAEVLITLVIIGIIAAMTIPTLMKNTQNHEFVTGLKKANSVLSQGLVNIARNNDASPGDYSFIANVDFVDEFAKVANVVKKCNNSAGCFGSNIQSGGVYKNLNGINLGAIDGKSFITTDGQIFSFVVLQRNTNYYHGVTDEDMNNGMGRILVDLNGHKGPNVLGRDVFCFYIISNKGIIPAGSNNYSTCTTTQQGYTCAARVLKENAIKY